MSAIFLAKNHTFHARTKYIDVRYHFVREILEEGEIQVEKVDTKDNPADMLTKNAPMYKVTLVCGSTDVEMESKFLGWRFGLHLRSKHNKSSLSNLLKLFPLYLKGTLKILLKKLTLDEMEVKNFMCVDPKDIPKLKAKVKAKQSAGVKAEAAVTACAETKLKMNEIEKELSTIVGLENLKLQLRDWAKGMLLDEKRRSLHLKIGKRKTPHMAFMGNPGTGKTMVARVLGRLLHKLGILATDRVTEVQRTDLVGEYIGHTGPKTRKKIEEAIGGILFVDEAYRLVPSEGNRKDFGIEALEEIMSFMDTGKIVVIFAGYTEPMKRVISSNMGFSRRVTKSFVFGDFTVNDLAHIFHLKMKNMTEDSPLFGFKLDPSCDVDAIAKLITNETTQKQRKEMNGGLVYPALVNGRESLDRRLDLDTVNPDELLTLTLDDIKEGLFALEGGDLKKKNKKRAAKSQVCTYSSYT
ncbi:hypothetical protein ACHQM5_002223 [Ranunculus cassubicifolius]